MQRVPLNEQRIDIGEGGISAFIQPADQSVSRANDPYHSYSRTEHEPQPPMVKRPIGASH
jgi:hypothetical protein